MCHLLTYWLLFDLGRFARSGYSAQPNRPFYPFPMPARPHVGDSIIDELKCLNLHITLPRGWTQDAALPIIMFIHGG